MKERAGVVLGGVEHMLNQTELLELAERVRIAQASLLDGECVACGGKMDAQCFVCDAKVFVLDIRGGR